MGAKMMQKNNSGLAPSSKKEWQRTTKQKKFLKKPKNKTAKKQYFKELEQILREESEAAEALAKNDLETFAKVLEFADISKELDLKVLGTLLYVLTKSMCKEGDAIETFFNLARHNILAILF